LEKKKFLAPAGNQTPDHPYYSIPNPSTFIKNILCITSSQFVLCIQLIYLKQVHNIASCIILSETTLSIMVNERGCPIKLW
jgi:hypothetical protein